jgi:fido (protein-threonine AMPylation protein)
MTDLFDAEDGQTELTREEREGLKLAYVTFRGELNAAEQENIASAARSLFGTRRVKDPHALVDHDFLCATHRKMYGKVWKWAGQIRTTDKNIGVPYYEVHTALRQLLNDAQAWLEYQSTPPTNWRSAFTIAWSGSIRFPTATVACRA